MLCKRTSNCCRIHELCCSLKGEYSADEIFGAEQLSVMLQVCQCQGIPVSLLLIGVIT